MTQAGYWAGDVAKERGEGNQRSADVRDAETDWDEAIRTIRAIWAALNKGDYQTPLKWLDPEVELQDFPSLPDARWHRGTAHEAAFKWTAKLLEVFDRPAVELETFRVIDARRVLIEATFTGRGKRGGVPISGPAFSVVTMTSGKVARMALFRSKEEALEAVGLRE